MSRDEYDDQDDFLTGGGVPSCSFLTKGTRYEGEVLKTQMRQQRDITTGKPKFWENDGSPMMSLVITLQTEGDDEREEEIEDDDGRRALYIDSVGKKNAMREAVKEAGVKGVRPGGWLSIEFTGADKPKKRGHNGAKRFTAEYEPPDENADADAYLGEDDEDEDSYEVEKPAATTRKRAAKKAPAKKAPAKRARRRPEPEEPEDEYEDEPEVDEEPPARGRGRRTPAKKAPAKKTASRGRARRQEAEDDDYFEDDEDAGF